MNSLSSGYRILCWPWFKYWIDPRSYYYWMKYKIQRAQRGWADCDVWSLDDYLTEWLPGALLHLKKTTHGVPNTMFTDDELNHESPEGIGPNTTSMDQAVAKWDATLDKMIAGFEAHRRLIQCSYEKELGPWPTCTCADFLCSCEPHRTETSNHIQKMKPLEERDRAMFKEGMALFAEHFGSLWD